MEEQNRAESFARQFDAYQRQLAVVKAKSIMRPKGFSRRPPIDGNEQKFYTWVEMDITADRFKKALKKKFGSSAIKNILAKIELELGDFWVFRQRVYKGDGTFQFAEETKLEKFLAGILMQRVPEEQLRKLECICDAEPNEILTQFNFRSDQRLDWFLSLDYLDAEYQKTSKFHNSPRVKAFYKRQEEEAKARKEQHEENLKVEKDKKKTERKTFLQKLKDLATSPLDMEVQ